MQIIQHKKESRFIEFLKKYTESHNEQFLDVHENYASGIDVYYLNKPYDLKVSNSKKLTLQKKYKGEWYDPLVSHIDIPYLYIIETPVQFLGFVIDKDKLLTNLPKYCNSSITQYTGDGNLNNCIELKNLMDLCPEPFVWRK